MPNPVRVRFAPSPTGFLHVGGLRTALYNYLFARNHGGKFILRIEDTDQSRKVEGAVENLIATLDWAGIHYDEGPNRDGGHGPYVQSQRLELYHTHAQQLVEQGKAYSCFCTPTRLDEIRKKQAEQKLSPKYDWHCRNLSTEEVKRRRESGETSVVRMKIPEGGETAFEDIIRGRVAIANAILDDQVILKSDGFPTYHLAVVVDDHLMEVSHIIRGEEWLPSTPKHVLLYQYFGWEMPQFAHLPLLLNPDKSKLSKRQGDVAVEDYRAKGYLKEALVNFVAFLGWNPGDEREIFTIEELIKEFSLERVGKAGAVFNIEKLDWFQEQHLRAKPEAEALGMLKEELKKSKFADKNFDDGYLLKVIQAMRERAAFVRDFVEKSPYFFEPPKEYDESVVKKRWKPETSGQLLTLLEEFSKLNNPTKEDFEWALNGTAGQFNIGAGELIHPLRLSLTGVAIGPGVYDIAEVLGKDETIKRIKKAIEKIK